MRIGPSGVVVALAATLAVSMLTIDHPPPRHPPSTFWVTDMVTGVRSHLATVECPSNMPDCTMTARERYRKFLRGGYGRTPAWKRLHYGTRIRHQIIHIAKVKWFRHHRRPFHAPRRWRRYTHHDVCVVHEGFDYWRDTSDYCARIWYRDPKRRFVKNVLICGGEIALAVIGSKGAGARTRKTVIGGTGTLCTWDKMR